MRKIFEGKLPIIRRESIGQSSLTSLSALIFCFDRFGMHSIIPLVVCSCLIFMLDLGALVRFFNTLRVTLPVLLLGDTRLFGILVGFISLRVVTAKLFYSRLSLGFIRISILLFRHATLTRSMQFVSTRLGSIEKLMSSGEPLIAFFAAFIGDWIVDHSTYPCAHIRDVSVRWADISHFSVASLDTRLIIAQGRDKCE